METKGQCQSESEGNIENLNKPKFFVGERGLTDGTVGTTVHCKCIISYHIISCHM